MVCNLVRAKNPALYTPYTAVMSQALHGRDRRVILGATAVRSRARHRHVDHPWHGHLVDDILAARPDGNGKRCEGK